MDALMLRSLQSYVIDTFGLSSWQAICRSAKSSVETFEPLMRYDPGMADLVAQHAAAHLGRAADTIWEDVGTYLVTSPDREGVRRLLRFGGGSYTDFLHSLEEMPGRARLALPDLELPEVMLVELGPERFELSCKSQVRGVQRVFVGMLTAMADDYGVLCVIKPDSDGRTKIEVLDPSHAAARPFDLALPEQ
jgi:hypothetical protein